MMRQVVHQTFFEPDRFAGPRNADLTHLVLAIGRVMSPPVVRRRSSFQPVRVIVFPTHTPNDADQVRLVHQLPSVSPREPIEVIPAERDHLRVIAPESSEQTNSLPERFVPGQLVKSEANNLGHRKLFNDPGQWRVVTWGEFKEILAPQLAHPERLRDNYRLPCYVQVIETQRDVTIEELAKQFSTTNGRPKPLYFLTDEIAAKLEITSLLPQIHPKPSGSRDAKVLLAHERVFGLVAANDPTADVGLKKEKQQPAPAAPKSTAPQTKDATDTRKTSIPSGFVKEWEFKLSRDEAFYDINRPSFFSKVHKYFGRLRIFRQHKELQKWQVMLTGKTADEQLWTVRPPREMLVDSFIREWAKKTLDHAGYDSEKMIQEWEVFWRRKGAE